MKTRLLLFQMIGVGLALGGAWWLLGVPDSTVFHLALSLVLMYLTVFVLSFTLAAVAATLAIGSANATWREIIDGGRRCWWRAGAVVMAGMLAAFLLGRAEYLSRIPAVALSAVVLLAIPFAVYRGPLHARGLLRGALYAVAALALGHVAFVVISTPWPSGSPWLEMTSLIARTVLAYIVGNIACLLMMAAGAAGFGAPREAPVTEAAAQSHSAAAVPER